MWTRKQIQHNEGEFYCLNYVLLHILNRISLFFGSNLPLSSPPSFNILKQPFFTCRLQRFYKSIMSSFCPLPLRHQNRWYIGKPKHFPRLLPGSCLKIGYKLENPHGKLRHWYKKENKLLHKQAVYHLFQQHLALFVHHCTVFAIRGYPVKLQSFTVIHQATQLE